ncbi:MULTISPECIES: DsbA family protein [unclassified Aeromicrobium]|uniref:DsbA family protein n=1 Tax=unclassified Aeromicrobium TaxID=2633570 RepID=UPI00396AFD7B
MTRQARISLVAAAVLVIAVVGLLGVSATRGGSEAPPVSEGESRVVRGDSQRLGPEGTSGVTFVEFLDFECEGCLAAYPVVERLRETYAGRVTFVVRHFPLHGNSERAARAAEAAGRQGAFEPMYRRLFESVQQWGHRDGPADATFRRHAAELGLDVDRFADDFADPAVAELVARDMADGLALDVSGTPTFFVDGKRLEPRTVEDLARSLDAAIAARG